MTKPKTKLVCMGWGIMVDPYDYPGKAHLLFKTAGADTKEEAIELFNGNETQDHLKYKSLFERGFVIAKKLWVEVKS